MRSMKRLGRPLPAISLLLILAVAISPKTSKHLPDSVSAADTDPVPGRASTDGRSGNRPVGDAAEIVAAGAQLVPLAEEPAVERSRAILRAVGSMSGGDSTHTASPSDVPLGRLQNAGVEIYSDAVAGCTRLEGLADATLDCSMLVGSSFSQRFRARAVDPEVVTDVEVRITPVGLVSNMSLNRLGGQGQAEPGPVQGIGGADGRLDFAPSADQVTVPGTPIEIALRAERLADEGGVVASATVRLRIHVLPADSAHVVGFVFEDRDGDGQRDSGEPGLDGWDVEHLGGTAARSDAHGRFEHRGLAAGSHSFELGQRAGWVATPPPRVDLEMQAGRIVEVHFGLRPGGTDTTAGARLQTDRGCGVDVAVYQPGETVQVFFEVTGLAEADVSLERRGGGGSQSLLERRRVPGSQAFGFEVDAGQELGKAELHLSVFAPGANQPAASASCSYRLESAEGPTVSVAPLSVDFGNVAQGASATARVTIRNDGQAPLLLNSLAIQGGGGSAFRLNTVGLEGTQLAPGQSQVVDLGFSPTGSGSHQDFLLLRCNAGNQPLVSIPLYGSTQTGGLPASGYVRTDRGCLETQENPLYFVGDPIALRLRVDGQGASQAAARIDDIMPGGQTRVIFSRNVPVGQELDLGGARVLPPVGYETLRLTAQVGYELIRNECSFRVAAGGSRIVGYKFEDKNGNGIWEGNPATPWIPGDEPPIPGWGVTLTGPESYGGYTDANGRFEFVVSTAGRYYVTEEQRDGWQPTRPASVALDLQCYPGEQPPEIYFGNKPTQCQPGKDPCFPTPTPGWPTQTPVWPSPTPASATATVAVPTATPTDGPSPTAGAPTQTPPSPPPPPVCSALISPRPSLMNVGELAQFGVAVSGGGQVLGYQWSVEGEVIRDYYERTQQSWSVTPMTPADYQSQSIAFYWKPLPNQRHPQNAGPQPRRVSVTVTTQAGQCSTEHVLNVERNNNNLSRQAEDFYTGNHQTAILTEHTLWHAQYPFAGWSYDGTLFFDFHRQYLNRFNSWRNEFGYPPLGIWDSGTSIPNGVEIDHAARNPNYTLQFKPSWFTLNGVLTRPGNSLPCDTSRGGERNLRDYPANRRLLGCATTHPWHNAVHTAIGGDMLNPQFSPRDPVFWRWHGFVDIISQERMGVFAAALFDRIDPNDQRMPALPDGLDDQERPPYVVYQEPFRLYRFLADLPSFTVEFDQPVSGVSADDLLVDGRPATEVERISNQRFVFRGFPQPPLGRFELELAPGGIRNVYNVEFGGERWSYHRVDPDIDEDRDGLVSREELEVHLTSPIDRDSDDDGLSDGDEVRLYDTRPLMWDSDLDGAHDRCEIEKGSDPNDPSDTARGCPVSSIFVCWAGNGVPDR